MGTTVQDVMTAPVVTLRPDETVHEAAERLAGARISGAPVVENGKVVGIISETDILRALAPEEFMEKKVSTLEAITMILGWVPTEHRSEPRVVEVMSSDVITVSPATSVWAAAGLMDRHEVNRLPVIDAEGELVGVVSRADLVRAAGRAESDA
jgi:CBS domain-containing protein